MSTPYDDLGAPVPVAGPAARVVSLVPSLTEALVATRRDAVVGATDWCTHPADLDVVRVRGTKNPDVRRIAGLAPDLVVANREENRELDVRRLREAGVPVWVTVVETLDEAFAAMRRLLLEGLRWEVPGWLEEAERVWATAPSGREGQGGADATPYGGPRVAVPVWRDPWMVVGPGTFTGDLLSRLGCRNVFGGDGDLAAGERGRYPALEVAEVDDPQRVDLVLLPDEPYVFTADDGPEAFTRVPTALVSGRLLTWYGPSLVDARSALERAVRPSDGV